MMAALHCLLEPDRMAEDDRSVAKRLPASNRPGIVVRAALVDPQASSARLNALSSGARGGGSPADSEAKLNDSQAKAIAVATASSVSLVQGLPHRNRQVSLSCASAQG